MRPEAMSKKSKLPILASLVLASCLYGAMAQPLVAGTITVPSVTIYPGDIILNSQLLDEQTKDAAPPNSLTRSEIVGRVARKTLIKEQPIPYGSVEDPKTFKVGAQVQLIFQEEGLTIVSSGMALQSGSTGDSVRVRNSQSGQVVVGLVTPEGAIKVGTQ